MRPFHEVLELCELLSATLGGGSMPVTPGRTRLTSVALLVLVIIGPISARPYGQAPRFPELDRVPGDCASLVRLTFDGNTTISSATPITSGTAVVSAGITVTNLPPFCRVQGVSKPSSDSNISFEVWLPERQNWNTKFLSAGEGGFAGTPNYTRNGLDGGLDELLRRGYATAGTDTGHRAAD